MAWIGVIPMPPATRMCFRPVRTIGNRFTGIAMVSSVPTSTVSCMNFEPPRESCVRSTPMR